MRGNAARTSAWRHMPAAIGLWLGVVALVNATMVYDALHSFPGEAGGNAFDISNHYDRVLQTAALEAALGWKADAAIENRHVTVHVSGTEPGATLTGVAMRPVGPEQRTVLGFHEDSPGMFIAERELPGSGRWDVSLTLRGGERVVHVTRRLVEP